MEPFFHSRRYAAQETTYLDEMLHRLLHLLSWVPACCGVNQYSAQSTRLQHDKHNHYNFNDFRSQAGEARPQTGSYLGLRFSMQRSCSVEVRVFSPRMHEQPTQPSAYLLASLHNHCMAKHHYSPEIKLRLLRPRWSWTTVKAEIFGGVLFSVTLVPKFLPKIKRTQNFGIVLVYFKLITWKAGLPKISVHRTAHFGEYRKYYSTENFCFYSK